MIPIIQLTDGEQINLNTVCRTKENDNSTITVYFSDGATVNYHGDNFKIIKTASAMNQQIYDGFLMQMFKPQSQIIKPT